MKYSSFYTNAFLEHLPAFSSQIKLKKGCVQLYGLSVKEELRENHDKEANSIFCFVPLLHIRTLGGKMDYEFLYCSNTLRYNKRRSSLLNVIAFTQNTI